ncbi:MAG: type IVB secretion system coupling complex protein DotM/IcmP [Gammaproteobacteria bacterium]|nr:type IVB secretion system coupling complex protein DotM/IcmP [Gammaproteobacteria bacterium]MBP9729034.1 type IVB secretion system coupling complex protein DotM/IcmP [Gammaproteobacteria bacterium]
MASNSGGGQDQGAEKNAYYMFWLLVLISMVAGIIWYYFHTQFKWFFLKVRVLEFQLIYFFLKLLPEQLPWVGHLLPDALGSVKAYLTVAQNLTTDTLSLDLAGALSNAAGSYLRYPVALYLLCLSIIVFKTNVHTRLKKKFTMRSLALQEQINWPQIKIVTQTDLVEADLETGPWAMAMTPLQFAKKNKLITILSVDAGEKRFAKMQTPEYTLRLHKARAERAFGAQLGRPLLRVEQMLPHRKALFAALAGRACRDGKTAGALLIQLANSAADGALDCEGVDALCAQYLKNSKVKALFSEHAYEFTLFISLLLLAREDGVVASADFLWVKPVDRRLWYVINNVGRQTPAVEVGGIFNHWYYEVGMKRALSTPKVEGAVEALNIALSEVMYMPSDEEKAEILKKTPKPSEALSEGPSTSDPVPS